MQYSGNILMIGCGAVAQCSIPLILQHISLSPQNITIIDPVDTRLFLPEAIRSLIQFETTHLTKNNYAYYLSKYLRAGDICIDLANEVDTYDILTWCQQQGVNYLNTSLNHWPTKEIVSYCQLYKTIQHYAQQHLNGPTAVLTHGANPGLISSFVKQGLLDMAQHACIEQNNSKEPHSMGRNTFSQLAQLLDIKIIHIAEQDTQTIHQVSHEDEFLNAWSTVEFIEECLNHAEFAWGTHEQYVPENAEIKEGNIFFKNPAFTLLANSWIPYQEFIGMIIPHDEAFTIADYLSLKNKNEYLYRPSVLFVYDPCPAAKESLHTLQAHNFVRQSKKHVIKQEIIDGTEKMGCLLISPQIAWWTGSLVSIQESNRIVPGHNATVLQVAAGVLTGLQFLLQNPQKGICFPETLDHVQVLNAAKPYLGEFISLKVDWNLGNNYTFPHYAKKL